MKSLFLSKSISVMSIHDSYGNIYLNIDSDESYKCIEGSKTVFSRNMFKMDPNKKYQIDIDVKSMGTISSKFYLSVNCFRSENPNSKINSTYVSYMDSSTSIIQKYNSDSIFVDSDFESLTYWMPESSSAYMRYIGFYFNGDVDKTPDIVFDGYNNIDLENNSIILAKDLPKSIMDKIIPDTTVIRNHYGSNPFVFLFNGIVPKEWTHISRTISGINIKSCDDPKKFRRGTEYFTVGFMANDHQDKESILAFKNFKISVSVD
jgi:hypothetical protein